MYEFSETMRDAMRELHRARQTACGRGAARVRAALARLEALCVAPIDGGIIAGLAAAATGHQLQLR